MKKEGWPGQALPALTGKTVVLTGATGGLGQALCRYLLSMGCSLILVNRSREKSQALLAALRQEYPDSSVRYELADLEDITQVQSVCARLLQEPVDVLMLNAGTYAIPRAISSAGYDTVFQTNFLSHYYMVKQLLPLLRQRGAKVVATGSIAHRFQELDPEDPDFSHHEGANNIYGNSKRFLMFALMELLRQEHIPFAIGHPGISFTGITSHYPRRLLKVVRFSMKLLFMHPRKACRSMLLGVFLPVPYNSWIGPRFFDIWGNPRIQALSSCEEAQRREIFRLAETMYETLPH